MEDQSQREEFKIKDLLMKISVLKNGVIQERQKNGDLEKNMTIIKKKLIEYEDIINKKENLIISISNEKYNIQTKLDIEKAKHESINGQQGVLEKFTKRLSNKFSYEDNTAYDKEILGLKGQNFEISQENENMKINLEEKTNDFERCKSEYQLLIQIQNDQIKKNEIDIKEKKLSIEELNERLKSVFENYKKYDIEKVKFDEKMKEKIKENKILVEKLNNLQGVIDDKSKIIEGYQESIMRHEKESSTLARKLAELKNVIIESNMVIQNFKGERKGTIYNTAIEVIFGRTDEDEYVMILKEDNKENFIDIEDIEYLKPSENRDNAYDICYIQNSKQMKFILLLFEGNDKFIQVYKDYVHKSNMSKNNLLY